MKPRDHAQTKEESIQAKRHEDTTASLTAMEMLMEMQIPSLPMSPEKGVPKKKPKPITE